MSGEIGFGVMLHVSDAAPAVTPINAIGGVTNTSPGNPARDIIEVTDASSPGMMREYKGGVIDPGEASFEINWIPGNGTDVLLRGILLEREARIWRFTYTQVTPNVTKTFKAFLTEMSPSVPFDDKMVASITLKVSGLPVWA